MSCGLEPMVGGTVGMVTNLVLYRQGIHWLRDFQSFFSSNFLFRSWILILISSFIISLWALHDSGLQTWHLFERISYSLFWSSFSYSRILLLVRKLHQISLFFILLLFLTNLLFFVVFPDSGLVYWLIRLLNSLFYILFILILVKEILYGNVLSLIKSLLF